MIIFFNPKLWEIMTVTAFSTFKPFDTVEFMARFAKNETHSTGTVVIHHGKIKRPGKKISNFSDVLLEAVLSEPQKELSDIGQSALDGFELNQVLIAHRLGVVNAGGDVLFVAVSASTRTKAFAGCAHIVDAIKSEKAIRLVER